MMLQRQHFQTSRVRKYVSKKEIILQTGHEPDRRAEVILKGLFDDALDACESHHLAPTLDVTIIDGAIRVQDNRPGLAPPDMRASLMTMRGVLLEVHALVHVDAVNRENGLDEVPRPHQGRLGLQTISEKTAIHGWL